MDMPSPSAQEPRANWPRRVGWLLLIWLASVAALGVVALVFRLLLGWAGLTR